MRFFYDPAHRQTFPQLVTGLVHVAALDSSLETDPAVECHVAAAKARLDAAPESAWPEIRAWRTAFSAMGLKPTQYRCASEALLRRLRKDASLPRLHPLVDLCNAISAHHGLPVAAFDLDRIDGDLRVGPATGLERYRSFAGAIEHPAPGEVVFADQGDTAHARRWANRQSAVSAVSNETRSVLIVIEGLHDSALADVTAARDALTEELSDIGCSVRIGSIPAGESGFDLMMADEA